MSKPILQVTVTTVDEKHKKIPALFDSGSLYTVIRSDCLPSQKAALLYKKPKKFGTAHKKAKVTIVGETALIITIGRKMINTHALVSLDLSREMVIGAETMQVWNITIRNRKGRTKVIVGHDMREPDMREIA